MRGRPSVLRHQHPRPQPLEDLVHEGGRAVHAPHRAGHRGEQGAEGAQRARCLPRRRRTRGRGPRGGAGRCAAPTSLARASCAAQCVTKRRRSTATSGPARLGLGELRRRGGVSSSARFGHRGEAAGSASQNTSAWAKEVKSSERPGARVRRYQPDRRVSHPSQASTATEVTSSPQRSHPDAETADLTGSEHPDDVRLPGRGARPLLAELDSEDANRRSPDLELHHPSQRRRRGPAASGPSAVRGVEDDLGAGRPAELVEQPACPPSVPVSTHPRWSWPRTTGPAGDEEQIVRRRGADQGGSRAAPASPDDQSASVGVPSIVSISIGRAGAGAPNAPGRRG